MNLNLKTLAKLVTIFAAAYALKSFYSSATVDDLRWILAPTTFLVELISGERFTFESHAGYVSSDHSFLIAASCSGVNFLMISFLVLTLGKLWRERTMSWSVFPIAALAAYSTTLIANTVRIIIALQMHASNFHLAGLDPEEIHRIEGIVVYFLFLLLLFLISEKLASSGESMQLIRSRLKYVFVVYYGVTLGIPLLRGSYNEAEFWQHTWFVVAIPLVIIGVLVAPTYLLRIRLRLPENS